MAASTELVLAISGLVPAVTADAAWHKQQKQQQVLHQQQKQQHPSSGGRHRHTAITDRSDDVSQQLLTQ
jgi:hypothetical protein